MKMSSQLFFCIAKDQKDVGILNIFYHPNDSNYFSTGGDFAQGIDIWNPLTGSVITGAVKQLPQEAGIVATQGLRVFGLVSVNYNTELIFSGGLIGPTPIRVADVWSYKYYKSSWTKLCTLSSDVSQHAIIIVSNITCPKISK